ncbi:DUF2490 domain-containing protein [Algoriphagus aquimarinus]|uniref:DUF2490 domain-containing protein n=1 Tax=Algoriphagus aquimarinus TaxID=237018 RepID=A0A5C7B4L9_9BACT|nr:DUF2490 domain-containing protein [Algoriphagus aquimarinus]TXE14813.1 DUF2490 domain-containing protein [Algoriphagus aquimarinus]
MKAITYTSIFLLMSFLPQASIAQKDVTHQQLIWYGYFLTLPIDENWSVGAEVQERHFIHPFAQQQLSLRTHVHRKLGQSGWEVSAGFATFFQSPNNPRSELDLVEPELRAHIEMAYKQKFEKLTIDHRYRAEARYFHKLNLEKTGLANGYYFGGFRFRYRILASYPIWKINENQVLKVIAGDELMVQAGKKISYTFDQNRIIAGLGLSISPFLNVEATYQKWINQRQNGAYFNRDIVRIVVNHRLSTIKTQK